MAHPLDSLLSRPRVHSEERPGIHFACIDVLRGDAVLALRVRFAPAFIRMRRRPSMSAAVNFVPDNIAVSAAPGVRQSTHRCSILYTTGNGVVVTSGAQPFSDRHNSCAARLPSSRMPAVPTTSPSKRTDGSASP